MVETAGVLLVGNELLTGKVADENLPFVAKELFQLGISLRRVVICPDEMDVIVADLNALRMQCDVVFTSGGVGPTHDDITIDAVAKAFERPLIRSAEIEALIRSHHGSRVITEGHLRMANIPEGAELIRAGELPWPTIVMGNVFVLPGVPLAFRLKFAALRDRLDGRSPFHSHAVYTRCDEGEIAELLTRLTLLFPNVTIGSYVRWGDPDHKVKLTFDSKDPAAARDAASAFVAGIPASDLIRREGPDDTRSTNP